MSSPCKESSSAKPAPAFAANLLDDTQRPAGLRRTISLPNLHTGGRPMSALSSELHLSEMTRTSSLDDDVFLGPSRIQRVNVVVERSLKRIGREVQQWVESHGPREANRQAFIARFDRTREWTHNLREALSGGIGDAVRRAVSFLGVGNRGQPQQFDDELDRLFEELQDCENEESKHVD